MARKKGEKGSVGTRVLTLVPCIFRCVALLHDPVDVTDSRAHEERKEERHEVVIVRPNIDVDGIQNEQ